MVFYTKIKSCDLLGVMFAYGRIKSANEAIALVCSKYQTVLEYFLMDFFALQIRR